MTKPDAEAISLAGAVLSRGNPFGDAKTAGEAVKAMLPPSDREKVYERLSAFLSPYFQASLSLAGHILGNSAEARPAVHGYGHVSTIVTQAIKVAGLLKGIRPHSASWETLTEAAQLIEEEREPVKEILRLSGLVIERDTPTGRLVTASYAAMTDRRLAVAPWPARDAK